MKRYEKYKPSGIEWIGEVPEQWGLVKTKFVCTLNTGNSLNAQQKAFYGEITEDVPSRPYIASKDIDRDTEFIDYDNGIRIPLDELSFEVAPANSTLLCIEGGSAGKKMGFVDREVCYVNKLCCFNSFKINPKYQYYFVKSRPYWEVFSQNIQGMIGGVSVGVLKEIKMPLPSPAEQEAIAAYLDARCGDIDKVVTTQEKRVALLNEMKQSIITQAVTRGLNPDVKMKDSGVEWIGMVPEHWEVRKIKYCCKDEKYSIKTGPFGTQLKGEDLKDDGPVCVYNQRNVIDDDFTITSFFVSEEKASQLNSFYTKPSDVLITSRGTIGKCSILPEDASMGILHPCLIAMRINQTVCNLNWLKLYINETNCFTTDVKINSNATTIDVIYTDTLKNIDIPMPSIDEQEEILSYLDVRCGEIDKQIKAVTRQIELLREYKQSLITEVVTGKRKVC